MPMETAPYNAAASLCRSRRQRNAQLVRSIGKNSYKSPHTSRAGDTAPPGPTPKSSVGTAQQRALNPLRRLQVALQTRFVARYLLVLGAHSPKHRKVRRKNRRVCT